MELENGGLYIILDQYFEDYPNVRHMSNKHESRPYYLAIKEKTGVLWLIPLSSQTEKYKEKIKADERKHGECIYYYTTNLKGRESVFLIGNVIPASNKYIKKAFTVSGKPFVVRDKADLRKIKSKLSRYLAMVRRGVMDPAVDILKIEQELIKQDGEGSYKIDPLK